MNNYKQLIAHYFMNLIALFTLVGVLVLGYNLYSDQRTAAEQKALYETQYRKLLETQTAYKQLSGLVGQLETNYKKQEDLLKEINEDWKALKIERGERVKSSTKEDISIDPTAEGQAKADYTFLIPKGHKGYELNELHIAGKNSPPIGYILVKNDGEVFKKNYKFEVHVESVQLKDDSTGKVRVVSRAFLVSKENGLAGKRRPDLKKWAGEKYPLKVTGGEVTVDPKEPIGASAQGKGWIPWTMNLNAGMGVFGSRNGEADTKVTVDTNLFGYGHSKQDLDWKLLQVGLNYSAARGLGIHVMPFSYRPLPNILVNSYVGVGAYLNPDESGYFIGLNVGF